MATHVNHLRHLAGTAAMLLGCSHVQGPEVAAHVDLERYQGRWYELARLPFSVQKGCQHTTAEYWIRDDGKLSVRNHCFKNGKPSVAGGVAWVPDPATPAKLKVQFFWPFRGDYWILALDPEYEWALVGTPDRKYLWVLSRHPTLAPERFAAVKQIATERGYDVGRLEYTTQGR